MMTEILTQLAWLSLNGVMVWNILYFSIPNVPKIDGAARSVAEYAA